MMVKNAKKVGDISPQAGFKLGVNELMCPKPADPRQSWQITREVPP